SVSPQGKSQRQVQDLEPCFEFKSAEARCVYPRVHTDAEEAEFSSPKGSARSFDERHRGYDLHSGYRTQPAGALDRVDSRWPRKGSAGRSLSRSARDVGRSRRTGTQAEPLKVWREAAQGSRSSEEIKYQKPETESFYAKKKSRS